MLPSEITSPAATGNAHGIPFLRHLSIPGVGSSGGVTFMLEDRSNAELPFLTENLENFFRPPRNERNSAKSPPTTFCRAFHSYVPTWIESRLNGKASKWAMSIRHLQTFLGGYLVNISTDSAAVAGVRAGGRRVRERASTTSVESTFPSQNQMVPISAVTSTKSDDRTRIHYALQRASHGADLCLRRSRL